MTVPLALKVKPLVDVAHKPSVIALAKARKVFRSDPYRLHLGPEGAEMPRNLGKVKRLTLTDVPVTGRRGPLIMGRNRFFDGRIFDPGPSA